jgi:hypothetical protein
LQKLREICTPSQQEAILTGVEDEGQVRGSGGAHLRLERAIH